MAKTPLKKKKSNIYVPGHSPEKDAWFTAFLIENHLDHITHPDHAAPPEQVRFMVYLEEDERYYPCSKRMFESIMGRKKSEFLRKEYRQVLNRVMNLMADQVEGEKERHYLEALIKIKYEHETRDQIMIPSRLEKRLIRIFLDRTQIEDPYLYEKAIRNFRADKVLRSNALQAALNHIDPLTLNYSSTRLSAIRGYTDQIAIQRLFSLTAQKPLWETKDTEKFKFEDFRGIFAKPLAGNGVKPLNAFLGLHEASTDSDRGKKILWLANEAGEVMVDLAIIKYLTKLGHRVIIVFKEGPLFTKVDFYDAQSDETLKRELEGSLLIEDHNLGKNQLVQTLKSHYSIIVISDGTRENLNLLLASTTFARMFKEVDAVISRGHDQKRRFMESHFQFTQDIFNISGTKTGTVNISYKPRHPAVVKFSHGDLEKKAGTIIEQMAAAKKKGMTIVFYSGIIGSIPGKIKTAKKIMAVFVEYLKEQSAMTHIINPSEHFEPGMDADDLMYMWEIVQRSGLIDIWRFQTYEDIAQAFRIMKSKVPPEWVGKDATFSTGCTKEMTIALDVQDIHPEMHIIGPAKEKFMRRKDYGIGKMYDRRFSEVVRQL
ncbi:MAG: hypothetical protein PVI06_14175 [Desulfobacterales bacterium]|jgi:hypothetical protein